MWSSSLRFLDRIASLSHGAVPAAAAQRPKRTFCLTGSCSRYLSGKLVVSITIKYRRSPRTDARWHAGERQDILQTDICQIASQTSSIAREITRIKTYSAICARAFRRLSTTPNAFFGSHCGLPFAELARECVLFAFLLVTAGALGVGHHIYPRRPTKPCSYTLSICTLRSMRERAPRRVNSILAPRSSLAEFLHLNHF